jgi:hypothetical protein
MTKRFDIRKIRKLDPRARYGELYFYWREAELMIASSLPSARRYGRRLKKRVESLYFEWFKPQPGEGYLRALLPEFYPAAAFA